MDHERWMLAAIAEAEKARGGTGDNPWVGCVIVGAGGDVLGVGHTMGPGEDHAEIGALRMAKAAGRSVEGATLYSTLEPCSFHGRTPACARTIVEHRLGTVVSGMRDPNPRVDGLGAKILTDAGIAVVEGVCEREVRRQLGTWVLTYHPHDLIRRACALHAGGCDVAATIAALRETFAIDEEPAATLVRRALDPTAG